jgi:4-carboxymuconolactone decarboxylase
MAQAKVKARKAKAPKASAKLLKAKVRPNPRNKKLYDDGMKMRKAVLGADYVDNSMAGADDFMMSFQDVTTEY